MADLLKDSVTLMTVLFQRSGACLLVERQESSGWQYGAAVSWGEELVLDAGWKVNSSCLRNVHPG